MIDSNYILDQISAGLAMWCPAGADKTELVAMAEYIAAHNLQAVSLAPDDVMTMWPWLENIGTKIMARFYAAPSNNRKISADDISELVVQINAAFKHGADGAQVFVRMADLDTFVSQMCVVCDDLFFNKKLSVGLDINEIDSADWENVFQKLQQIKASSLLIVFPVDRGVKSDFVGRIYGMLNSWGVFDGELHFALGQNLERIEQAARLLREIQPAVAARAQYFVAY